MTSYHPVEPVRPTSGLTPEWTIQDRLRLEARRLLSHSFLSAAQVANKLSLPNPSQFGRKFRSDVGVAPGRYRQEIDDSPEKRSKQAVKAETTAKMVGLGHAFLRETLCFPLRSLRPLRLRGFFQWTH